MSLSEFVCHYGYYPQAVIAAHHFTLLAPILVASSGDTYNLVIFADSRGRGYPLQHFCAGLSNSLSGGDVAQSPDLL